MRVLKQSARILNISHLDPLHAIELAAKNCYQSPVGNTKEFIKMLLRKRHLSPFEMVNVQVELITDRAILAEITRHRLCSFNVESQRYCNYKNGIDVILPIEFYDISSEKTSFLYDEWMKAMINSEKSYQSMINVGAQPQLARSVLPNSLKTSIIMSCNLRQWLCIFDLRKSSGAHPMMRFLMEDLSEQFKTAIPVIFDEI